MPGVSWPSPFPLTLELPGQGFVVMMVGGLRIESITYTRLHMTQDLEGVIRRLGLTRSQQERKADHILLGNPKTEMTGGSLSGTNVPQG